MFDTFLEGITDLYDDVDGFFKDLTGGDSIVDLGKAAVKGYFGKDDGVSTSRSHSRTTTDLLENPAVTTEPSGAMSRIAQALTEPEAPKAVDATTVTDYWYNSIYKLATGNEYNA